MPPTIAVPPELAALAPHPGPLRAVSVRLDPQTLEALEALAQRLGGAHRGVLLRHLIGRGLAAVLEELEGYAPVAREREAERTRAEVTITGYREARAAAEAEGLGTRIGAAFPGGVELP